MKLWTIFCKSLPRYLIPILLTCAFIKQGDRVGSPFSFGKYTADGNYYSTVIMGRFNEEWHLVISFHYSTNTGALIQEGLTVFS